MSESSQYQALVGFAAGRGDPGDWYSLGCELVRMGKWGSASGCFAKVISAAPEHHRAWTNWGWCEHFQGESEEAARRLRRAVELVPEAGHPRALLCQVLTALGRHDEACEEGRRGAELDPRGVNRLAYSLVLMNAGRWREGWLEYEGGFEYRLGGNADRPYRLWRGERVGRLWLEYEQGHGDIIFALRWLRAAAERADEVVLYVLKEMYALVRGGMELPANVSVYPVPRPLPVFDVWCPLMSLPAALGVGEIEWGGVYVHPDKVRPPPVISSAEELERELASISRPGLKIGIVWAGSPAHERAMFRDSHLAYFLPLTEIPDVELHSLQVGPGASQMLECGAYGLVVDRSVELTNFLDTAKVVAGLDLVICVDTAVGHLAGAMGVPCWLLLNQRGTDYRWGRSGVATGWYPEHRLFRREMDEATWIPTMDRVEAALRELVGV